MTAPTPFLKYAFWGRDTPSGDGIFGDGPRLASVMEVTASLSQRGVVEVYARGLLMRKDGTPSRVRRGTRILTSRRQPPWLEEVVEDAIERLLGGHSGRRPRRETVGGYESSGRPATDLRQPPSGPAPGASGSTADRDSGSSAGDDQ